MRPQPIHYDWNPDGAPRKPDVLCIGAQKAGTSWLAQVLGQHPQVWLPPFKEAHYFNYQFIPGHRYWINWHYRTMPAEIRARHKRRQSPIPPEVDAWLDAICAGKRMFTNHWYKRIFAPAPAHAMPADFSPEYSTLPDEGVAHVARFLGRARVIYLIRDPVDRAVSQLRMNLMREKRHPVTLDDWLTEVANPVLAERGDYAAYVPRWQRHFGERLLILPYGSIGQAPDAVMQAVETHLGIGAFAYSGLRNRVFATPDGLVPPPQAVAALAERLAPQTAFLADTFGPDFLAETR
ncbi:MAG: sulfotransferase [Paracoccus sp. (in: a-proteobacteria)]|uniref:sulfotransferase family protein n=1 Tax=Paracoccus sp. TaxID=267 RepID=UPI0026DF1EEE|nr:sulfotransferase [Paracoccus sp. (in: a-proteobacteria)]MDO5632808.1 sulfotransferase [Paracoccus sp. (in: a-proteobacteria)]